MGSPASIAKHPIHPMLIVFPIGLWIFSFVCDLIYLLGQGNILWNDLAFYTMAGGIIGALLAAIPGLIDLLSISDSTVKKIGVTHMILNLTAVVVFAVDLWLRTIRVPGDKLPFILSIIGVILIGISGWLGGEMVYVHGVAVEPRRERGPEEKAPTTDREIRAA
jgi:uncharacterized membrane protein